MKSLLLLVLGGLCGAIAAVLAFTVDTDFSAGEADGAGGGNLSLILTEEALATLVASQLSTLPGFGVRPAVEVTVGSNGLVKCDIAVGGLGVGFRSSITVNPNIVDGSLRLEVVDSSLGELALPEQVRNAIEAPLASRIESLAGGLEYRVTSIRTTEHRLTIEVEI